MTALAIVVAGLTFVFGFYGLFNFRQHTNDINHLTAESKSLHDSLQETVGLQQQLARQDRIALLVVAELISKMTSLHALELDSGKGTTKQKLDEIKKEIINEIMTDLRKLDCTFPSLNQEANLINYARHASPSDSRSLLKELLRPSETQTALNIQDIEKLLYAVDFNDGKIHNHIEPKINL